MLSSAKISFDRISRYFTCLLMVLIGLFATSKLHAVEYGNQTEQSAATATSEKWIKLPIRIQPIEKVAVRDFKGVVQDTYVNHQTSLKNLRIRANRSNELYFGPWRFQVDASRLDRLGGVDISVRVSHIDQTKPDTYFDLGQKLIAGKVLREGSDLRFITQAQGRFQNDLSPFLADIEFGVIEDSQRRMLSALDFVTTNELKNSPNQ